MKKQSNLSCLLGYAEGYKRLTLLGCVLSGVAAILGLIPYVCVWLVAHDILSVYPNVSAATELVKFGWIAVWFAVGNIALYFVALMCTHIAAFRTARNMRHRGVAHILEMPLGFFTENQSGHLRKIIDDNAALTEDLLAHKLPDLTAAVVTPVAAIILLLVFDWKMGLLCLLTMLLAMLCMMSMMGGKNAGFFHRYQREIEKMSAEAVEYVRGIPVVKVFQQTVFSFKAFYAAIQSYSDLASQYAMSCRKGQTGFLICINGAFALLIPAALFLASGGNGWTVLADFIFYVLFAPACGGMINRIMFASESVMEADEAIMKMNEILKQQPLTKAAKPEKPKNSTVAFEHVTFSYPNTERPVLRDVNFTVEQGTIVGLVGPSGGGKSTVAALIPRFWDVDRGCVKIGGVDVRDINNSDLMDQVAFVFQDTKLFKISILENIRMARPSATLNEVKSAAKAAQCDDILEKLPQGIDTVVGTHGIYLSGGEAQRIALARAILKDAPIVVLDEATAFADPENEALIQKAFEELTRDKTVLMIAHRLSTIQNADKILVIEKGNVKEQGTHKELLAQKGLYAKMWQDYQSAAAWKVVKEETE